MAWVLWALATAAASVTLSAADGGYGHYPVHAPSYHAPVPSYYPPPLPPPPPISYAAIPVYGGGGGYGGGGKKGGGKGGGGGGGFGNILKGLGGGLFGGGGGKGKGKGKGGGVGPAITPVHLPPPPPPVKQHHVVNVKVPQCKPLTHYVTQVITKAQPVSGSPTPLASTRQQ